MHVESSPGGEAYSTARAFEELYVQTKGKIFGYAARRVGPDLAEEVTAQAFAEAWATRHRYDPERGTPMLWLLGITTNILRHHYRSEMSQLRAYTRLGRTPVVSFDRDVEVLDAMVATDNWSRVANAMVELSDTDREILTLSAWTELSYNEIASMLGVSVGTVKSRMNRARGRLMDRLEMAPSGRKDPA